MSATKKIVTTYAKALFQNVKNSKSAGETENYNITELTLTDQKVVLSTIYIVGEELSLLRSLVRSSQEIQNFFQNPTYSDKSKLKFLSGIFPGISATMRSFLKVLSERSHLSLLGEVSEEYNRILLSFQKSTKVRIITPSILEESYGTGLLKTLKQLTSAVEITLNLSYDPRLLGGLILEYNSSSIDASILKEFSLFFNEM